MGQDFNKVEAMVTELDELEVKLSDPSTHSNPNEARRIGKRHAELKPVVAKYREWIQLRDDEIAAREMGEEDSAFLAEAIEPLRELLPQKWVISAVKGIEPGSHQIIGEYLHDNIGLEYSRFGAIVGPCHAEEIALERLSYLTVASENEKLSNIVADKLRGSYVKVRCTTDIYGTEYAAVLKNIYAIAAGLAQGLGYGDNFQAVLVSNALREMKRVIGAVHPIKRQIIQTEYSGDLFVTMYSPFSRNRRLGLLLGKGYSLSAARAEMSMIAEGYYAAKLIREVKREREVKMPIALAVYKVLYENASPKKTLRALAEKLK